MPVKSLKSKMGANDIHIVINGDAKSLVAYDVNGKPKLQGEAHCYGQHADWTRTNGDTPPGVYEVGEIFDTPGEAAYGWYCIDLIDLEGQESKYRRAGISIHGGGTNLPNPFAPRQGWLATHGCVRVQNFFLEMIVKLIKSTRALGGRVFVQVYYPNGRLD